MADHEPPIHQGSLFPEDDEWRLERATVRRVVSHLEETGAESPSLELVYGSSARSPREVERLLRPIIGNQCVEVFVTLLLNGKHRVAGFAETSRGTLTSSLVHPREVFGPAVRMGAAAVIVAHNHPSGDPAPSTEDIEVSRRLKEAGALLGIPLLDHVILGADDTYVSLRERPPW